MLETHGKYLIQALNSLRLLKQDRVKAIQTTETIMGKVVGAYEKNIGKGHVGKNFMKGRKKIQYKGLGTTGLIYGRIQSGKTRAMILSTALAFDNGFRIVVVMTSNINDLVSQTHLDFTKVLTGVSVYTKDNDLKRHIEDAKLDIESADGHILIIASKGATSLRNIGNFLKAIGVKECPLLIFDDEGDQASLDTNNRKRSAGGNGIVRKSTINKLILELRRELPASVYISVTGTPQAVLLQSVSSDLRPSFIHMLSPGADYVGGDYFFDTEQPEQNKHRLISIIPASDRVQLLSLRRPISKGLKESILFFILAASAVKEAFGLPNKPNEEGKGYQYLCHPGLRNNQHALAEEKIRDFLREVKKVLMGRPDNLSIMQTLTEQYEELKTQAPQNLPSLQILKKVIHENLVGFKVLTINASNPKRKGIEYGPGLNFLVGGNTLGRGIAIPNLLVTYYVRTANVSQIDTMHQHARMFGYRMSTLPYTRLFTTRDLYYRFRDIHRSDAQLRDFIQKQLESNPNSFPVEISLGLTPTRSGVLEVDNVETVTPGMQIYPNHIKLPQSVSTYQLLAMTIAKRLNKDQDALLKGNKNTRFQSEITAKQAIEIIELIKTRADNTWSDRTIGSIMEKLCQRLKTKVLLRFRYATRKVEENGLLSSGTISGAVLQEGKTAAMPTLWIMCVTAAPDSLEFAGKQFWYPTIVVPNALPKVFVFSKK